MLITHNHLCSGVRDEPFSAGLFIRFQGKTALFTYWDDPVNMMNCFTFSAGARQLSSSAGLRLETYLSSRDKYSNFKTTQGHTRFLSNSIYFLQCIKYTSMLFDLHCK